MRASAQDTEMHRQHMSVVQAASALEVVAAAANALARGEPPIPSMLSNISTSSLAQNPSNGEDAAGMHSNNSLASYRDNSSRAKTGSGVDNREWDAATLGDAGHVAQSLEQNILHGQALLDLDFLNEILSHPGLRNALEFSAGDSSRMGVDVSAIVDPDTSEPANPVPNPRFSAELGQTQQRSAESDSAKASTQAGSSLEEHGSRVSISPEMEKNLRDLNVKAAALGLGLAKANQGSESAIRSTMAKVSDCEIREVELLKTSEHQDSLMVLAAKSFFNRTTLAKVYDALAPITLMSERSVPPSSLSTKDDNLPHARADSYRRETVSYRALFPKNGMPMAANPTTDRKLDSADTTGVTSYSTQLAPGAAFTQGIFSMYFLDLCRRSPTAVTRILTEFTNRMDHNLASLGTFLRPIRMALTDSSRRNYIPRIGSDLKYPPHDCTSRSQRIAASPRHSSFQRGASSRFEIMPGVPTDVENIYRSLVDYIENWQPSDNIELGRASLISLVTCAIHEGSVLQLLHAALLLLSDKGRMLVDGSIERDQGGHIKAGVDGDPVTPVTNDGTSFIRALNPSLDVLRNAGTEPQVSLPTDSNWLASISLPKPSALETPQGVDFSLRIEGGSITIGKDFLLHFSIPKEYSPGPDDFIGLYDSAGNLVDWYKATEERRAKGLLWSSGKLQSYSEGGTFELQYVHRVENDDGSGSTRTFKMGTPLAVSAIKRFSSCTNDGARIFVYNESGLFSYGTGFGGTVAGSRLQESSDDWQNRRGWLAFASGYLYLLLIDPEQSVGLDSRSTDRSCSNHIVELVRIDPNTLSIIDRRTVGENSNGGSLESGEKEAFLSAAATFANSSKFSSSSLPTSDVPASSRSSHSPHSCSPNSLDVELLSDLHRLMGQARRNIVLFSDGNLLYTITPAQKLDDDVLLSPPRSASRALRSPSPFSLGSRTPYSAGVSAATLSFSPGSPPSRTIDTKLSHAEEERKSNTKVDQSSNVSPSDASLPSEDAVHSTENESSQETPIILTSSEALSRVDTQPSASVAVHYESKHESTRPQESKADERPSSRHRSALNKHKDVTTHIWRRGIKLTAFVPDTLTAVAHYHLRVSPDVGFEVKPRSKYYQTPSQLTASSLALDGAATANGIHTCQPPCIVFCGPGAQRCHNGILQSWSLHSEMPGTIELSIWRRYAVNIVVRVASFKIDGIVKGRQIVHVPRTPVQEGDFLGIIFPIHNAAAITYDESTSGASPVGMAAVIDPIDDRSARLDGVWTSRRYSICAHIDSCTDDTSIFTRDNYCGSQNAGTPASPRVGSLKNLFSEMPPRPELLSVYCCGDSIGLVTKNHVWSFVKSSSSSFTLSGFRVGQSTTKNGKTWSSHFDPFSAKSFRKAESGTCVGPASTYDPKNNFIWLIAQDTSEIKQYMGPFPPPQWTLDCPSTIPSIPACQEAWCDVIESAATNSAEGHNLSSSAALTIIGHSARLCSTFSASVRVIKPMVNSGQRQRPFISKTKLVRLPQVGDICEAQYHGRRNRSSWGYRGVQILAVNVLDSDMYRYTYDVRYPDGDQEAAVLPKHIRIQGQLLSNVLAAYRMRRQSAVSSIGQNRSGHGVETSLLQACQALSHVPFCINVKDEEAEKLFVLIASLLEVAVSNLQKCSRGSDHNRNQNHGQEKKNHEIYHAVILFSTEILRANILASEHSGRHLVVSARTLRRICKLLLRIVSFSTHKMDATKSSLCTQKGNMAESESGSLNALRTLSTAAARVLSMAPHIFFDSASDALSIITLLPSLSKSVDNIDALISLVMCRLCDLPRYVCINERGVAYRSSLDKFDRFEAIRGPEPGQVIAALEVFDRNGRTIYNVEKTNFYSSSSEDKPNDLSNSFDSYGTEAWIRVAVDDSTEKFIPLTLSGEYLFMRVNDINSCRGSFQVACELKKTILELIDVWGPLQHTHFRPKCDYAKSLLAKMQTHLIASMLGRDAASRRPAIDIFLWYTDKMMKIASKVKEYAFAAKHHEQANLEEQTSHRPLIQNFVSPILVALRVALRSGWIKNLCQLKALMQNSLNLFANISSFLAIERSHSQCFDKQNSTFEQHFLLLANVASESCNQVLVQFPSIQSKHIRMLMQSLLFKGGLQVGTNGKSLSSILGKIDSPTQTGPMKSVKKSALTDTYPGGHPSPLDELSPPRLRRISTHLEEDTFLRELVEGNIWTQSLQEAALSIDRRAKFRRRVSGCHVDRAERAIVAALIKHCGMLVDAHSSMKDFRASRNQSARDNLNDSYSPSPKILNIVLRARSVRDWLQRIRGRTGKSMEELSLIVVERAALLLTVKPSSNVPRLSSENVKLSAERLGDASMTHRGMVLHEHLASIRQRSDSSHQDTLDRDIATDLLMFVMSDDLNICNDVRGALQRQQQCAVVRISTLNCLAALFGSVKRFGDQQILSNGTFSQLIQALLLPALPGLRMMWEKKSEMTLPAAGLHMASKLGNAWKAFFQELQLVPSLDQSHLSCLRAEILSAMFVYQQPMFSADVDVVGELLHLMGNDTRKTEASWRSMDRSEVSSPNRAVKASASTVQSNFASFTMNVSSILSSSYLHASASSAYQLLGLNMLEAGGQSARVIFEACCDAFLKSEASLIALSAGASVWDCSLCSFRNKLANNICLQCGTPSDEVEVIRKQKLVGAAQKDCVLHHLIVLQCALTRGNVTTRTNVTRFLARYDVLMTLMRLWSSPGAIDSRSSAVVHALLDKCLSSYSFEQWHALRIDNADVNLETSVWEKSKSEDRFRSNNVHGSSDKAMLNSEVPVSGGDAIISLLFRAVSNLVQPKSSAEMVSGLRAVSLLSRLMTFDESWSIAISSYCVKCIKNCLDDLKLDETSARVNNLGNVSVKLPSVLKALAVLAAMGGASRPKIFFDGCVARLNNSMVMVVGKRAESPDTDKNGSEKKKHQISEGDLVEALYHGNSNGTRWYKQTVVTRVHEDGTVDLRYHDDDIELNVESQYIKINGETLYQIRERSKARCHPKDICTVITTNSASVGEVNSGANGSKGKSQNRQMKGSNFSNLPELNDLTVKEVDLVSENFVLDHKWLTAGTSSSSILAAETFKLLEALLRVSKPTAHESNAEQESLLYVQQARLLCLRVFWTILESLSVHAKAQLKLPTDLVHMIFRLAGSSQSSLLPVPSQGEARARASQSEIKVGDFVRSPGDSPQSEKTAEKLIGCVQSISSDTSSASNEKSQRLCLVRFPDGREATYHEKNLEVVVIDGTGLVDTMSIAEAESALWKSLNSEVEQNNKAGVTNNAIRHCITADGNSSKTSTTIPVLTLNNNARSMLESIYGKGCVPSGDALEAAVTLYATIGPLATFAKPKTEVSLLAPEAFVGARVKIEWPGDDWYPGVVDKYDKESGRHHVSYDDGDTRWYKFTADRKHAISESENKLPLRFVGGTISHESQPLAQKNRRLVLSYMDFNRLAISSLMASLPQLSEKTTSTTAESFSTKVSTNKQSTDTNAPNLTACIAKPHFNSQKTATVKNIESSSKVKSNSETSTRASEKHILLNNSAAPSQHRNDTTGIIAARDLNLSKTKSVSLWVSLHPNRPWSCKHLRLQNDFIIDKDPYFNLLEGFDSDRETQRSVEINSLPLLICGNKYNMPRFTKLHAAAEVLYKSPQLPEAGAYVSPKVSSLTSNIYPGKDEGWKGGIIVGRKDSTVVEVRDLMHFESSTEHTCEIDDVNVDNIRFSQFRAPLFGLSIERRAQDEMRFVFTTSSVDVEENSNVEFHVRGKPGTLFSDLEGYVDGSSISFVRELCKVNIVSSNSAEAGARRNQQIVKDVPIKDLEVIDGFGNSTAFDLKVSHLKKLKVKTVKIPHPPHGFSSSRLYRIRTVYGRWHTIPQQGSGAGRNPNQIHDNLENHCKDSWQHISVVFEHAGTEDLNEKVPKPSTSITCKLYRNGCIDGQLTWPCSEGIIPTSSVPLYIAPLGVPAAELKIANMNLYSQTLSHEDVLTDMHSYVLEKRKKQRVGNSSGLISNSNPRGVIGVCLERSTLKRIIHARGLMTFRQDDSVSDIMSLTSVSTTSSDKESDSFADSSKARKKMHLNWLNDFNNSLEDEDVDDLQTSGNNGTILNATETLTDGNAVDNEDQDDSDSDLNEGSEDEDDDSEVDGEEETTYASEWMVDNLEQWNNPNTIEAIFRHQHHNTADESRALSFERALMAAADAHLWPQQNGHETPSTQRQWPVRERIFDMVLEIDLREAVDRWPIIERLLPMGFSYEICIIAVENLQDDQNLARISDWILNHQEEQLALLDAYRSNQTSLTLENEVSGHSGNVGSQMASEDNTTTAPDDDTSIAAETIQASTPLVTVSRNLLKPNLKQSDETTKNVNASNTILDHESLNLPATMQQTYPALCEILRVADRDTVSESDSEALALKLKQFSIGRIPYCNEQNPGKNLPGHVFEALVYSSESYIIVARRKMSAAPIEIDPLSLIACDPFESTEMSSAQILLDALPPSFRRACINTSNLTKQTKQKHLSVIMNRLECYYARMCATEILSMSQQILRSSSSMAFTGDRHDFESIQMRMSCDFDSSFKSFLQSIPIEHAPEDRSIRSSSSAYVRVKTNLSSLVRSELKQFHCRSEHDTKKNDSENKRSIEVDVLGELVGVSRILEDVAIGHLLIASIGWNDMTEDNMDSESREKKDPSKASDMEKSLVAASWRRHAGRACWFLELLLNEFNHDTPTRLKSSRFIKLLIITLRTAAGSNGDERLVLRLLRIYGKTRQLRCLDKSTVTFGHVEKSGDYSLEYPTDRACMKSLEIAFEKRLAQTLTSEMSAKSEESQNQRNNENKIIISECTAFDQALASLLIMNGDRRLNGDVSQRLQRVCWILEFMLSDQNNIPTILLNGTPGSTIMGRNWLHVADCALIEAIEDNDTTTSSIASRLKKVQHKVQHKAEKMSNDYSSVAEVWKRMLKPHHFRARMLWLVWLNQELLAMLPLVDFSQPGRFVQLISRSRNIILHKTKRTFMQSHFKKRRRARDRSGLVLHLNRFSRTNLFQQAFSQLQRYGGEWINFRKPWKCVFDGEGGSDAGGPGRESVTAIMESVFTKAYHLFVSTPNDVDPSAGTNDAILREDRYLPTPRQQHRHRAEYEMVGKFLGMSMREQWSVPVRLARSVWRQILGAKKNMNDLRDEDYSQWYLLQELQELASQSPEDVESMGLDFTVRLSDNRVRLLKKNGDQIPVTASNVSEFVSLASRRRIDESRVAISSIIRGFGCVVPLNVVSALYTWEQLEREVCGTAVLNVDRLRAHTSWPGELGSDIEENFWAMLRSFDPEQQSNFLRFCWGRTRLPADPEKKFLMRVKPLVARGSNSIDDMLPNAHTCDFTLLLPAYSSFSIMRDKFLRGIAEQGFDLDGGAHGFLDNRAAFTIAATNEGNGILEEDGDLETFSEIDSDNERD